MDQNNQVPQVQPSAPAPLTFKERVSQDVKDLWDRDRAFLIAFGIVILAVKFRDLLISLLLASSKRVEDNAQKEDSKLASQENDANTKANELVQQAQQEPKKEGEVAPDWYKNEK